MDADGTLDNSLKYRDTIYGSTNRIDLNKEPGSLAGFCFHS
jgi:hypothetical protein